MIRSLIVGAVLFLTSINAIGQTVQKIENEILGHLAKLEKASNYGGAADYDVLSKENKAFQDALIKYGSRADVLNYGFPKLKDKMYVVTSRDGKFRAYSWDTEEGGTMHDFVAVYQYRGASGKAHTWTTPYTQDMEERGAGEFVHQIFQTATGAQPIYLAVSTFIGSTSLAGQSITAYKIAGEKLDTNPKVIKTSSGLTNTIRFAYDFFSVVDHPERPIRLFSYNEGKRSFRFPVVIEDSKTPQGRVTNRFITYRFDGKYFVKVS
jgi:hypothetical protein